MRILIDLDSIVVDLLNPWLAAYNADYDDNLTVKDIKTWDTHKFCKPECGKKMYDYLKRPGFFASLKPLSGAVEAVKQLASLHQVYIVTAAPDGTATEKVHWVGQYLPFLNAEKQTVVCFDKFIIDADLLIDDSPKNLAQWKEKSGVGYPLAFGIRYPYNTDLSGNSSHIFLADNYDDTEKAWHTILRWVKELYTAPRMDFGTRYEVG